MRKELEFLKPIRNILVKFGIIERVEEMKSSSDVIVGKNNFYHKKYFYKRGIEKVYIGSFCSFGQNVRLLTSNHNYKLPTTSNTIYYDIFKELPKSFLPKNNPIKIGSDVWIGDNAIILNGVKVWNGAVIGAGSIVTKNIEPYSIVAGVPAKLIKYRFEKEIIKFLLNLEWWNWNNEKIKRNKEFFMTDLSSVDINDLKKIIK